MIVFVLLFSTALIVHELGHLLAALAFRVRVSKLCLFFDPWFRVMDTGKRFGARFCIGWIPFGAYVKFLTAEESTDSHDILFENIHPLKRIVISLSGVMMNLLTAYLCAFAWVGNQAHEIQDYTVAKHIVITDSMFNDDIRNVVAFVSDNYLTQDDASSDTEEKPHATSHKRETGISLNNLLFRFVYLNIFLSLFNLLPMPPLDGAQILYHAYEYLFHKPVSIVFQAIAGGIGFAVIMGSNIIDLIRYVFPAF